MNALELRKRLPMYAVLTVLAGGLGVFLWQAVAPDSRTGGEAAAVTVPQLSAAAANGKVAFDAVCAACHGANAAGSKKGPPLVHNIYNPGHHADAAFFNAARFGSRQHHWQFGDMPPQPQLSEAEVLAIVQYVRELQQANGIVWQKHQM
jgi:mono/diheme cytochrome c family protein